jgi:hypothetical protein
MGPLAIVGLCIAMTMTFDFFMEMFYEVTGFYIYGSVIKPLTLFYGHYYQFPIYEAVFWGIVWGSFVLLRYFRNDKGESLAERGLDRVRVSRRTKTLVSFLAIFGAMNLSFSGYSLAQDILVGRHGGAWIKDITSRSYFMNGICGAGTTVACPGQDVPIPRVHSVRLGPDGSVVIPKGAKLPTVVPQK